MSLYLDDINFKTGENMASRKVKIFEWEKVEGKLQKLEDGTIKNIHCEMIQFIK